MRTEDPSINSFYLIYYVWQKVVKVDIIHLFPNKYKGNANNIICRSNWERKFCKWCDSNPNILEWGSEEFFIPYLSPTDNRVHRYFPDFIIKVKESNGQIKRYVIEVKPKKQTRPPIRKQNPQNLISMSVQPMQSIKRSGNCKRLV